MHSSFLRPAVGPRVAAGRTAVALRTGGFAVSLPACHSRRELPGESRLFFCAHPRMHARDNLVTAAVCRACPLWRQPAPESFRPYVPGMVVMRDGPCAHLGAQIGERDCPSCRGRVRVKVFACGHPDHAETTLDGCGACVDYRPVGPPRGAAP